jgi:PAS domain S-box-containing protein
MKLFGRRGEAFLGAAMDSFMRMPDALVVITDPGFRLLLANDYFYEYFGCAKADVAGMSMHDFLGDGNGHGMSAEHIRSVIAEGHIYGHEAKTTRADGSSVAVRWNQSVFGGGKILSIGLLPLPQADADANLEFYGERLDAASQAVRVPDVYTEPVESDPDVENDIRAGLDNKLFTLYYQPRVNARTKAILGAEALIRLSHPERGLLAPSAFIPVAEKTGIIVDIGHFVIEAACRKLRQWITEGHDLFLSVSVNISTKQFLDENFVSLLLSSVTKYSVEPSRLMLELSERTIAQYYHEAQRILATLRGLGFRIAIDDYGSGFLPLSSLAELAIDNIKIDRSYLADSGRNPHAYPIMESIIVLAHGLNMTVTAEGVETREQLDFLLDNSVDYLQGYLISKPLPEAEFDRFIRTNPDFYTRHI